MGKTACVEARPDASPDASTVNRELTAILAEAGKDAGFDVVLEYSLKGGRLDVAWCWTPEVGLPGLDEPVPVVGFEIESSWRTRKHLKGDWLNLHDAGVALGVIVLAGTEERDAALQRFAHDLVARPGPRCVVWTADDVRRLPDGSTTLGRVLSNESSPAAAGALTGHSSREAPRSASPEPGPKAVVTGHVGKYRGLHQWLLNHTGNRIETTMSDIEDVLGFPLPASSHNHLAHWYSYEGSAVARAILDAGWRATAVNLTSQGLTLVREAGDAGEGFRERSDEGGDQL